MPRTITNLVFQGGSVKGIAYLGALEVLEREMDLTTIKRVAGTSAGAITASLMAVGCNVSRIKELTLAFDFKKVLDDGANSCINTQSKVLASVAKQEEGKPFFFSKIPVKTVKIPVAYRLLDQRGIFEGEYLRLWLENLMQEQVQKLTQGKYTGENLTFLELHQLTEEYPGLFRDLFVVGANLTIGEKVVFSYDNPATQHVIISDAIRISMSIPGLFRPHCLHCKINGQRQSDRRCAAWVDGGLYDNYPIDCFDQQKYMDRGELVTSDNGRLYNPQTLGFRLVSKERKEFYEGVGEQPENELSSALAFYKSILDTSPLQEEKYGQAENIARTVYIDHLNISTLAFNLSKIQQKDLIKSGQDATQKFFNENILPHLEEVSSYEGYTQNI
jgi:predicted acylesterase/phospholipase RssA